MRYRTIMVNVALAVGVPGTVHAGSASYTVRSGDGLWLIANRNAVSVTELVEANGLTLTSTIHPGDTLTIPEQRAGAATSSGTISVRSGDSVWSIAAAANITLAALLASNDVTVDSTIHPGRSQRLPGASAAERRSSSNQATTAPIADGAAYVVKPGDGLTTIARRIGVAVTSLLSANALTMTSLIHPGQRLVVPAAPAPAASASGRLVPVFARAAEEAGVPADFLMAVGTSSPAGTSRPDHRRAQSGSASSCHAPRRGRPGISWANRRSTSPTRPTTSESRHTSWLGSSERRPAIRAGARDVPARCARCAHQRGLGGGRSVRRADRRRPHPLPLTVAPLGGRRRLRRVRRQHPRRVGLIVSTHDDA